MNKKTHFGQRIEEFYRRLEAPKLPRGITAMNPHREPETQKYVQKFLYKYFGDNRGRILVFGINPGRFGAGVTGVGFTDPVALENFCGIANSLDKKRELSSVFVYDFIQKWGGAEKFYSQFFLTAVSPLGFLKKGINYNYYDNPKLLEAVEPFVVQTIRDQIASGGRREVTILLGSGKNQRVFNHLNEKHKFFKRVLAVDHPRFVMQYKRKQLPEYLEKYREVFELAAVATQ